MNLAWATDIHLNFLDDLERQRFLESITDRVDALAQVPQFSAFEPVFFGVRE